MDRAAIRAEIAQRNALRKSAQLPLLDEQKEFDNAFQTILLHRNGNAEAMIPATPERHRRMDGGSGIAAAAHDDPRLP